MEFTDFLTNSFYQPSSQNVWDSFELSGGSQLQDFGSLPHSLLLETLQPQTQPPFVKLSCCDSSTILQAPPSNVTAAVTSEALCCDHLLINSPNSSSISSAPSEVVNEEEQKKKSDTSKQLKPKKNSLKKQKEARVAFVTKSEVDHLEDGYRWRKYGQKAVKNSPFPRSYYRCTTASCNVKKRVERSLRDPSTVVTTYEGQHTHISPLMSRPIPGGNFGFPMERSTLISPQFQRLVHYHQQQELLSWFGGVGEYVNSHANGYGDDERVKKSRGLVNDNGLLHDVVPSHMLKEEYCSQFY